MLFRSQPIEVVETVVEPDLEEETALFVNTEEVNKPNDEELVVDQVIAESEVVVEPSIAETVVNTK